MFALIARISQLIAAPAVRLRGAGPAQYLMEGAEACAGIDPQRAQELRGAAYAYLRVVR
jgi:hypothetical protein